jgi:chemotaxis protein histidine kinase CheA
MKRIAELARFAQSPTSSLTPIATTSPEFFVTETNNIAAGLELLATRPDDRDNAINVLRRVRALRGVAGMRDVPALAEVSEAAEAALRPIELGEPALGPARVNLLRIAGDLLRAVSNAISTGKSVTTATPEYTSFLSALDAMMADATGSDRVIPIADLFYHDAGPHLVHTAPNPPTTPAQRFRMEVVSLGEHLHRVIDEARAAGDEIQREHAKGQLGRALRAIRATAASFGQMGVAQTVEAYLERTGQLNVSALDAIASFATTISPAAVAPTPAMQHSFRQQQLGGLPPQAPRVTQPRAVVTPAIVDEPHAGRGATTPVQPPASHARVFEAPPSHPSAAPTPARGKQQSLDSTIAAFESLSLERLAEPAPVSDADLLPVDALLYRGRAALDRAIELADQIRRTGGPPAPEVLEELYDLVGLARVE